jgi:hypothetical protein
VVAVVAAVVAAVVMAAADVEAAEAADGDKHSMRKNK